MTVVFRFDAPDPRRRMTITFDSVDAAVGHVAEALNGPDRAADQRWTTDEDGDEPPLPETLRAMLERREIVTLFDQGSLGTIETLEICAV